MTTKNVQTLTYISALALILTTLGGSTVLAQDSLDAANSSTSANGVEDFVVETTTAPKQPWYKVEQLTGTVNQGDFVVGPGRAEIEVKPGQTVVYEMSVSNRISDGRTFKLEVEDVSGSQDASQAVMFLGDQRGPYTIKDYISFPEDSFNLALGERARIPVTITVPPDAEPGGYYGGVLVSTIKDDGTSEEGTTVRSPIIARIGTLFFITVPGEVIKSGETKSLSVENDKLWFEKGPIKLSILFENTGSNHLNPYGELRIKNIFNEEVGFVEMEPWFVLPKSLRTRDISWDREVLFGRYTATAFVNRGYDDVIDEVTVTFWVMPWKIVLGAFLTLFLILFGFRFILRTFEFKRRA